MATTKAVCSWDCADEDASHYETTCGHAFGFNDDGPKENGFHFCPYCGGRLVSKRVRFSSKMRPSVPRTGQETT